MKAGHDDGQYVRDARNAGEDDITEFFEQAMAENSSRAQKSHEFLRELGGTDINGPEGTS